MRIGVPPLRLEVMNEIAGVNFADCFARRIEVMIAGLRVSFIDRESLRQNKRAAGRPKDLADIASLSRKPQDRPGRGWAEVARVPPWRDRVPRVRAAG